MNKHTGSSYRFFVAWNRSAFSLVLLGVLVACSGGSRVKEAAPVSAPLGGYRVLAVDATAANKDYADALRALVIDALQKRSKAFPHVVEGPASCDLTVRARVVSIGSGHTVVSVDLFDEHSHRLVGQFEAKGDKGSGGNSSGGLALIGAAASIVDRLANDENEGALEDASHVIASYMDDHAK